MAKNVYSERFLSIVDKTGICDREIADSVDGLDKTLMSHIRTGRQGASLNVLSSFCEAFPQVNANYILTGRGSMFIENENSVSSEEIKEDDSDVSLTYDELSRLHKTTISRYERLFKKLKNEFEKLEETIIKADGELNKALEDVRVVINKQKTA